MSTTLNRNSEFPVSMSCTETTINGVGLAASSVLAGFLLSGIDDFTSRGNISWISSNINEGHYDYYSWLLAGLSLLKFYVFSCL